MILCYSFMRQAVSSYYSQTHNQLQLSKMDINELIRNYASRKKRVINFFIDGFMALLIGFIIKMILLSINFECFADLFNKLYWNYNSTIFYINIDFESIIYYFSYYFICESFFKTTIAKLITKTQIVKQNGTRITIIDGFKRSFLRLIPLEQLSYLSMKPVGIHDTMSNTRVINK